MNTTDWLTEEEADRTRRRRLCLGCGEQQEYAVKGERPSYVAWYKAHLPCRELVSTATAAREDPTPGGPEDALAECVLCGFAGAEMIAGGKICRECHATVGAPARPDPLSPCGDPSPILTVTAAFLTRIPGPKKRRERIKKEMTA